MMTYTNLFDANSILNAALGMSVGQLLHIPRHVLLDAFSCHPLSDRTPEDALLEKLPGSGWGSYQLVLDPSTRIYTLSRHEVGERRVRHDWDRRHLLLDDDADTI